MALIKGAVRKPKSCQACKEVFTPTGNAAKFCKECASFRTAWGKWRDARVKTLKAGGLVGVGSGGMNRGQGKGQQSYRRQFLKQIHSEQEGRCYVCYKPTTKRAMILHHKDHDRDHNTRDNLEGMCKSCHQIEHECWLNFRKV